MGHEAVADDVRRIVAEMPVCDIHTHLFDPAMGDLLLSGIDEMLTYHYHIAELFRVRPDLDYDRFWAMSTPDRTDLIWRELFVTRAPASEVGRGVVALLSSYGLDPAARDLTEVREWFAGQSHAERVDIAFDRAGVREVYMTNDPLDPQERAVWEQGFERDPRFRAALRLDSALVDWPAPVAALRALGYELDEELTDSTVDTLRRYLVDWCGRMDAGYMAISLPPTFRYPDPDDPTSQLIARAVIPTARELDLPVALMIGVTRQVNPQLRLAGDSLGRGDVHTLEWLACDHQDVRFLVTYLSRENQHALCVAARKFKNIVPFGCWWFVNNPTLIAEITAMRLDLLGLSFVPQHSDARVLEQVVFKWSRAREIVGEVLAERFADLAAHGHERGSAAIRADVAPLFDGSLIRSGD